MTTNPIFNETVTISKKEYDDLLEYKAICKELYSKFGGELQ